jgi:hypothetical protein
MVNPHPPNLVPVMPKTVTLQVLLVIAFIASTAGTATGGLKEQYQDEVTKNQKRKSLCLSQHRSAQFDATLGSRDDPHAVTIVRYYIENDRDKTVWQVTKKSYKRTDKKVDCWSRRKGSFTTERTCTERNDLYNKYLSCDTVQYSIENGELIRYIPRFREVVGRKKGSEPQVDASQFLHDYKNYNHDYKYDNY